jgi:hypothetical protein
MTTQSLPKPIDAEYISQALRRSGVLGDGRVTDITVETSYPTILSHLFRLRLTYNSNQKYDAPASLILKAGLLERPGGPWKAGPHEVAFYNVVASKMSAHLTPRCFDAHRDQDTGAWHLLFEDLTDTHAVATRWPLPPTFDQCETIIRTRARFHAAWWDDPRLGVTIGKWEDPGAIDQSMQHLEELLARFAKDAADQLSVERRGLYAKLIKAAPRLMARYHSHRHMTVIQGDAHVWNCFLPLHGGLDDVRLFDWDAWKIDVGSDDLAYMMAVHWYPELRSRIETRLLDCYHDELLQRGVRGYDRRALQDDYRLSVLWQMTWPIWQYSFDIPPVIWWNNFERIHLAVNDLHCRELLD